MKIAVVGAPGTGKSALVQALRLALQTDTDMQPCAVSEDWAPDQHHRDDLALLMGHDLPHTGGEAALQSDARLRHTLASHAAAYAVVYGTGQARTDCALQAIAYHRLQLRSRPRRVTAAEWQWCCDTCSDADCERRLFTALVNPPSASAPGSVRP